MAVILDAQPDALRLAPKPCLTFEQFLEWVDEDDYAEWANGKVVFKGTESAKHQDSLSFLICLLRWFIEDHDVGEMSSNPFLMKLPTSGRAPDLMFIAKENEHRLQEYYLEGPADWAIEIVSPESVLRDRGDKYGEYEAGGVREYWIIDPNSRRADFFVLDAEGRYQRATLDVDGRYGSAILPGFWINVGWLWQTPLPPVRQVLKAWESAA